jgi:hypothetical protein
MATSDDIKSMGEMWKTHVGECRLKPDSDKPVEHAYFYYGDHCSNSEKSDNHIHVYYNNNTRMYEYLLKCTRKTLYGQNPHTVATQMNDSNRVNYLNDFNHMIRQCFNDIRSGGYKKQKLRIKTHRKKNYNKKSSISKRRKFNR